MTRFSDRIESRDLRGRLSEVEDRLESLDVASLPEECRGDPDRLKTVIRTVRRRLDRVDPFLVPRDALDELDGNLETMLDCLDDLEQVDEGELKTANRQADRLLLTTAGMMVPRDSDDLEGLKEDVVSFRRSLAQHLRFYRESVEEALEDVKELDVRMNSLQERIDGELGDQGSIADDLEHRLDRLEEILESRRERIEGMLENRMEERLSPHQIRRLKRILNVIETVRRTLRTVWRRWGRRLKRRLLGTDGRNSDVLGVMWKGVDRLRSALEKKFPGWLSFRRRGYHEGE